MAPLESPSAAPAIAMSSGTPDTASIWLPCMSRTIPAGMARLKDAAPYIWMPSSNSRVAVRVSPETAAPRSEIVWLSAVMSIVMSFAAIMASLNCTDIVLLPV